MSITRNPELSNTLDTAVNEVNSLIKSGSTSLTPDVINSLRKKYSDDAIVDAIMEHFMSRRKKIEKVGTQFFEAFTRKYTNEINKMSLSKFLKKTLKYKKKYGLTDDEFDEVRRLFETYVFRTNSVNVNINYPNTNLSRVLGFPFVENNDPIKTVKTEDYGYLQEILKQYAIFKQMHSYVVIQTVQYELESSVQQYVIVEYDKNKHHKHWHVHPLIVGLFVPKIDSIDERMLYANIAGIINVRYNRERLVSKPDFDLFHSLVIDPSDIVCDGSSPMKDLLDRCNVQHSLWSCVFNLRSSKVYDPTVNDLVKALDRCRVTQYDNPDIQYLSDEGIILRRLFNVFSFRPIAAITQPIFGTLVTNPLQLPVIHNKVISLPYLTISLPDKKFQSTVDNVKLTDSIVNDNIKYYLENGSFVPKITKIFSINGPLIFYAPRRKLLIPLQISNPHIAPFQPSFLPRSLTHYNSINESVIEVEDVISSDIISSFINNDNTQLKLMSVVTLNAIEDSKTKTKIIIGHKTFIDLTSMNVVANSNQASMLLYDPANTLTTHPFTLIGQGTATENSKEEISTNGTIYIYVNAPKN